MKPQRTRRWPLVLLLTASGLAAGFFVGRWTMRLAYKPQIQIKRVERFVYTPSRACPRTPLARPTRAATVASSDPSDLVRAARSAYVNAAYGLAISLARRVVASVPRSQEAWQVIGASACMTKRSDLVRRAMRQLGTSARNLVRSVCQRAGIVP
ncbi:MAG: hypothetical protein KC503_43970 [Myxococcales bacterium]|nr:hypothetical protein [Myxococcales bacterium]